MKGTTEERLLKIADGFAEQRVAVLGDFLADVFVYGTPSRLSREAPVPILSQQAERTVPGSAGNVARNLVALGAGVDCIGALGSDKAGAAIREALKEAGAEISALHEYAELDTCTKTRIMAGGPNRAKQQVVRIDREEEGALPERIREELVEEMETRLNGVDAVILSDYLNRTFTQQIIEKAGVWAEETTVIVDSRYQLHKFRCVTAATPNRQEFENCLKAIFPQEQPNMDSCTKLREELGLEILLVTRGNEGMTVCQEDEAPVSIPIVGRVDVTDVTGAGDTVAAVFALGLASSASPVEAAHLANHAAGLVVTKAETATCTPNELKNSLRLSTAPDESG
ncbi:MAG: bifunctional heptose 7-phosphate kinase/heptose 1-phosphate adenyltransferase [Candidatus Brocadiia bacterium]